MSDPTLIVASVGLLATVIYAIFVGADFGGGVWELLATGERAPAQRGAIVEAISPVWETNHVWLIFLIVLLFTCFPAAFAMYSTQLYWPLTIVLTGIVLRGAAFVFRGYAHEAAGTSFVWGRVFGAASVITPLAYGATAGAVFGGTFAWWTPFAIAIAFFALAVCAQIAAIFLTCETDGELQEDFRRRAIYSSIFIAVVGALALVVASHSEPRVIAAMSRPRGLAGVGTAMVFGALVFGAVWFRAFHLARILVALEVVAIFLGWFLSQAPYFVPPTLTFQQAAAPNETLIDFLWVLGIGAVFFLPSLALLFMIFKGRNPATEDS